MQQLAFVQVGQVDVGDVPRGLAVVPGDGVRLAAVHSGSSDVRVVNVDAQGQPTVVQVTPVPGAPMGVAPLVAASGNVGVAVATHNGRSLVSLLRNAEGALVAEPAVSLSGAPRAVAAGNVDGVGGHDVVTVHGSGHVRLVLDAAGPSPVAQVLFHQPGVLGAVALGDLVPDGALDAAVVAVDSEELWVFPGPLPGPEGARVVSPLMYQPGALALGDVDEDGVVDAVVLHPAYGTVQLYPGQADGHVGSPVQLWAGAEPRSLVLADVDADGHLDLVVGSVDGLVSVQSPALEPLRSTSVQVGGLPVALVVRDLVVDGAPDVAVLCQQSQQLVVLQNLSW